MKYLIATSMLLLHWSISYTMQDNHGNPLNKVDGTVDDEDIIHFLSAPDGTLEGLIVKFGVKLKVRSPLPPPAYRYTPPPQIIQTAPAAPTTVFIPVPPIIAPIAAAAAAMRPAPTKSINTTIHKCPVEGCGKTYKTESSFKQHMHRGLHEKNFECPACGKKLSNQHYFLENQHYWCKTTTN